MTISSQGEIPTAELDQFEWLTLEALWSTAKSPYELQWQRWQTQEDIADPVSTTGLVIGGNLQRYHTDVRSATLFVDGNRPNPAFLGRAAEHLGKMAGGIIGIVAHFQTDPSRWSLALGEHLEMHFDVTERALSLAEREGDTADDPEYYYAKLRPVLDALHKRGMDAENLTNQGRSILALAGVAVRTWTEFMQEHEGLIICPGATPRSSGQHIEHLRADFEQYVPVAKAAAQARQV